jgi:hypothetical protein
MEKLALLRMLRDREISIIRHEEGFVESVEVRNENFPRRNEPEELI